jgi:hypothetical protein
MLVQDQTVFISYSRQDSEFALKLASDLKAAGIRAWIDQIDIQPGNSWDRAIEDALTSSSTFLVILSPDSVRSHDLQDEVGFALEKHKHVIPILNRDCRIPLILSRVHAIDFRREYDQGLASLLKALRVETVPPNQVPGQFEYDVYISYAYLDNITLPGEEQGWVTDFQQTLEAVLTMQLGRRVKMWFNSDPAGKEPFNEDIGSALSKTAVFIAVISPLYLRSEWCMKEVQEFCWTAEQTDGLTIDGSSRALKVFKLPVENDGNLPKVMKRTLGFTFYSESVTGGAPIELPRNKLHIPTRELAHGIVLLLKALTEKSRATPKRVSSAEGNARQEGEKLEWQGVEFGAQQLRMKEAQESVEEGAARWDAPENGPTSDVVRQLVTFICYSHEDVVFARKLAQDLRSKGARVWMDKLDIRAGQPYRRKIDEALRSCDRMIVIISPASVESDEVASEYTSFLKRRRAVIPVLYKECEMPYRLDTFEYADFVSREYEEAIQELLLSLTEN